MSDPHLLERLVIITRNPKSYYCLSKYFFCLDSPFLHTYVYEKDYG